MSFPGGGPPQLDGAKEALKFFATAFAFFVMGLVALVWNSPALARGDFLSGPVVGGLHLLTLGWLSLSIFGALQVFLGVALGQAPESYGLSQWIRRSWSGGVLLFTSGVVTSWAPAVHLGACLLGAGLVLMTIQLVPVLAHAKRGGQTRIFMISALVSLWSAGILGALAGIARAGTPLLELPAGYFEAHILMAAFGWVGTMVIAVGSHLIPMFSLSKTQKTLPLRVSLAFCLAIPIFGWVSAFKPNPWSVVAWSAALIASLLWAIQFSLFWGNRIRRERDYGLLMALISNAFLIAGWITLQTSGNVAAFGGLVVVGWLVLFTFGVYHRVIPFLCWYLHFTRPSVGGREFVQVKDLLDERWAAASGWLAPLGIITWISGIVASDSLILYLGSSALLAAGLIALLQLRTLIHPGYHKRKESLEWRKVVQL